MNKVAFRDMMSLAEGFGFRLVRVRGSHHILRHPTVAEIVNLQQVKGRAKQAWLEAAHDAGKAIPPPRYRPIIYQVAP